jgi:cold shock CspA family protein
MSNRDRDHGTVVHFSESGGYGFIRPDTGEHDIFMHVSQCKGETPCIRDRVTYVLSIYKRKNKPCANDVRFENDDRNEEKAAPGFYKDPDVGAGALAEGLKKLLRSDREETR